MSRAVSVFLVVQLLCWLLLCSADFPCSTTLSTSAGAYSYDLSPLTAVTLSSGTLYYLHMCRVATYCHDGVMFCYRGSSSGDFAYADDRVKPHSWSFIPGAMPSYGIQLTAYGLNPSPNCVITTTIVLVCDPTITGPPDNLISSQIVISYDTCEKYQINLRHASGCPVSTPAGSSGSTDNGSGTSASGDIIVRVSNDNTSTGIGIGFAIGISVMLVLLAVAIFFYRHRFTHARNSENFIQLDDGNGGRQLQPLQPASMA